MNAKRAQWYVLVALLVGVLFTWALLSARTPSGKLLVSFLDVGQGDATFIETPSGTQVLVDGGPGRSVLRALSREMGFFDRSLDMVLATHPDADHIGGLPDVLARYSVAHIVEPGVIGDTSLYRTFVDVSQDEGAVYTLARRGQVFDFGDGAYLRILFPDRDVTDVESNAGSIVAQLVYGQTEVLLTGDAPDEIETYITTLDGGTLASDILKAGHHGSRTSSDELFVGWASPSYAIISRGCGNRYGHPHEEVLETLLRFEVEVLDTCIDGTIVFESDGEILIRKR